MTFAVILITPDGDIHSTGVLEHVVVIRESIDTYLRDILEQKLQDSFPNLSADALVTKGWKLFAVERISGQTYILSGNPIITLYTPNHTSYSISGA